MSRAEILEKIPMNVVEVKAALEKIKEKTPELNFRAQKTEEYSQDFAKISLKDARELYDKLKALEVQRLKDTHMHKLIDLMPVSDKNVKLILSTYNLTPTQENCKKIADTIAEYAPKRH
jgi:DNA-directed RNA polymerase subunit F